MKRRTFFGLAAKTAVIVAVPATALAIKKTPNYSIKRPITAHVYSYDYYCFACGVAEEHVVGGVASIDCGEHIKYLNDELNLRNITKRMLRDAETLRSIGHGHHVFDDLGIGFEKCDAKENDSLNARYTKALDRAMAYTKQIKPVKLRS